MSSAMETQEHQRQLNQKDEEILRLNTELTNSAREITRLKRELQT